ncbi:hypothetical protein, partial [Candidatus Chlorohelix sp.]|uniref:hypothetical protein n=1 Tax=Candidatus Chlorohelix sp. TaxID=3139201 RepID=UPI00306D415B
VAFYRGAFGGAAKRNRWAASRKAATDGSLLNRSARGARSTHLDLQSLDRSAGKSPIQNIYAELTLESLTYILGNYRRGLHNSTLIPKVKIVMSNQTNKDFLTELLYEGITPELKNSKSQINEYHSLEIAEIYERTRSLENLRIQLGTFAGTINIGIISFAVSNQRSGFIFIATLALFLFIAVDLIERTSRKTLYERGLQLEKRYAPDSSEAILHRRYITSKMSQKSIIRRLSIAGFWLPVFVIIAEIALGCFFIYLGWPLF